MASLDHPRCDPNPSYVCMRDYGGATLFIEGYAAVFNQLSVPLGERNGHREMLRPGAFNANDYAPARPMLNHDTDNQFGWSSQLQLWTNEVGLACRIGPLAPTDLTLTVVQAINRGEVAGMSFTGNFDGRLETVDGEDVYVVSRVWGVEDVGPVLDTGAGDGPAYPGTGCWLSSAAGCDLPARLRSLRSSYWKSCPFPGEPNRRPISQVAPRSAASNTASPTAGRVTDLLALRPHGSPRGPAR